MLLERIQFEPGEVLITQTRRHWFVLFAQLGSIFVTALLPALLYLFFSAQSESLPFLSVVLTARLPELLFGYVVWLMLLWVATFSVWTNYYLDVLFITNRRVIVVNQKGFFNRSVSSFRLERLQDINVSINGVIPTLLDYGALNAQTAGHGEDDFRVTDLPHPRDLKATILRSADDLIVSTPKHASLEV